jgi:hypothetical protein
MGMSFTQLVGIAREIVKESREISYTKLAYLMRINPQTAIHVLKALSEVDERVEYSRGIARWKGDEGKDKSQVS